MGPINPERVDFAAAAIKAGAMQGADIINVIALAKLLGKDVNEVQDAYVDAKQAVRMAIMQTSKEIEGHIGKPPAFINMGTEEAPDEVPIHNRLRGGDREETERDSG